MLAAVRRCGCSLAFVPPPSAFDEDVYREIVMEAVHCDGDALESAPEELRDDEEIVKAAVKSPKNPLNFSLQWASARLKDDKAMVLSASIAHGHALQYASERLRNDHDCVVAACSQDSSAIRHVGREALASKNTVLELMEQLGSQSFCRAAAPLRRDAEVCVAAVSLDPKPLNCDDPPIHWGGNYTFDVLELGSFMYAGKRGLEALCAYVDESLAVHAKLRLLVYPRKARATGGSGSSRSGWPGSRVRRLIADFVGGPGEEHHRHLRRVHAKIHRKEVPSHKQRCTITPAKATHPGASKETTRRRAEQFAVL